MNNFQFENNIRINNIDIVGPIWVENVDRFLRVFGLRDVQQFRHRGLILAAFLDDAVVVREEREDKEDRRNFYKVSEAKFYRGKQRKPKNYFKLISR